MKRTGTVVLVHGLWHQPAHFELLTEELRARGASVRVPRLHRGSLAADTSAVQEAVDECPTPPLVLGHSYGGSVITGLERIRHLVYVAAFVPAAGESGALLGGPDAPVNEAVRRHNDGTTSIRPERAREVFYADCTEAESRRATSLLVPQQPGHGRGIPERAAWEEIKSTYLRCEQDRALSPALQERMARRCTNAVNLDASHSPFISRASQLAGLIVDL